MDNLDKSLLILGCGYVGSAIAEQFPNARSTHRNIFELSRRENWKNEILRPFSNGIILWTFPAASTLEEEALAIELYDTFFRGFKVFIYGSTSSYLVQHEDEYVTEETPLAMSQVRTRTEERLRQRGACILQLSGIFGPGRDPVNWYERGLIRSGLSYLNLIHLQDIVSITKRIFDSNRVSGERFNLSNGRPRTHMEIVELLKKSGRLPKEFLLPELRKSGSKRVRNDKLKAFLSLTDDDFTDFP
jgi:nucleoside-diphosphate-sugar epimerase